MPGFSTKVAHALGRDAAHDKLRKFVDDVRSQHADKVQNVEGQWRDATLDFAFSAYGMAVRGSMVVEESAVHVKGTLPLAAAFFRGQIEQTIRGELERLLR